MLSYSWWNEVVHRFLSSFVTKETTLQTKTLRALKYSKERNLARNLFLVVVYILYN